MAPFPFFLRRIRYPEYEFRKSIGVHSILALKAPLPPSSPIVRLTVTGLAKPFMLARSPSASNSKAPPPADVSTLATSPG